MEPQNEKHNSTEVIDVQEFAREDKPVPKGKHYRIRIDKETYVVKEPAMTGKEILALAGKTPENYHLYQHFHRGQTKTIQPNESVDFTAKGVERFTTMKIQNTEG